MAIAFAGCSRVGRLRASEEFRPAEPPITQTVVFEGETLFVVSTDVYDLASPVRSALWHRHVVDDVAWQFRRLFGSTPPRIAILLVDSSATVPGEVLEQWRGTAMAIVPLHSGAEAPNDRVLPNGWPRRAGDGLAAVPPDLAFLAARAWLRAAAIEMADDSGATMADAPLRREDQGPAATPNFPPWFSAAATNLLAGRGTEWELTAQVRERMSEAMSIDSLVGLAAGDRRREPLFVAQATSLLQFIRERDPACVGPLAARLAAGARFASALRASTVLPHDTRTLDQQWRRWLRESDSPRRPRRP
jgi:hypothetical protein